MIELSKLSSDEKSAINALKADARDAKAISTLNSLFWHTVEDMVKEGAKEGKTPDLDLTQERLFLDFGVLSDSLLEKESPARPKIEAELKKQREESGRSYFLSDWLRKRYKELLNFNKKKDIEKNISFQERESLNLETEIGNLQKARKDMYGLTMKEILTGKGIFHTGAVEQALTRFEVLDKRDTMILESLLRKKSISRGIFFSTEEKRKHIGLEKDLENIGKRCDSAISELGNSVTAGNIKKIGDRVEDSQKRVVETRERVRKLQDDLEKLTEETATLSPIEIENKLAEEVQYIRDLMRLSANRLRMDANSVLHGSKDILTQETIDKISARIDEFDPLLYKNNRVSLFGKPAWVLVPGMGNGVYDWKNNAIMIPTVPATTADVSIINAVVEYRIDVDEEKKMMFSYNQIKEYADIRSAWGLRGKFVKDYTAWMVSEYMGYKVMTRTVRDWFEHEIGPSKNSYITPLAYAPFAMSAKQYEEIESRLEVQTSLPGARNADDWFGLGVINAQKEKWPQAVEAFRKCVEIEPGNRTAVYNLAFVSMKNNMKPEAVKHFNEYVKMNPTSWWAGVARDHLMRLK